MIVFVALVDLLDPEPDKRIADTGSEVGTVANPFAFEIVEQERLKKGGSLDPLLAPKYVLFRVKAALSQGSQELAEPKVRATLRALLNEVRNAAQRRGDQIDGVSAFLYQSQDHLTGDSSPLGRAEWWPKGHSFSPGNVANIKNNATYVEDIKVFPLPKSAETVVQRLSENQRRAIYTELVRVQDRAMDEAEAKYPINASNIPNRALKTYDFRSATKNNRETEDKLRVKYEQELRRRYEITEQELDVIKKEGLIEQWPLPSP